MAYTGDAVAAGLAANLAQPGGNVTGSTYFLSQLMAKRLQLLRDAIPRAAHVAVLVKPDNPLFVTTLQEMETAASSLRMRLETSVIAPSLR